MSTHCHDRSESPPLLLSLLLQYNEFELEDIVHPGQEAAEAEQQNLISPQKKQRIHSNYVPQCMGTSGGARKKGNWPSASNSAMEMIPVRGVDMVSSGELDVQEDFDLSQGTGIGGLGADKEGGNQNREDDFWAYVEAVQCEAVGFVQLHSCLYAVEGWSRETNQGNRHWYHFELLGENSNGKLDELHNQELHQVVGGRDL
ncbi:hypothetical protein GYMLUDRAFT_248861 [Collybiopsis luxurians FD-317 M1]|uniref:Uncharacterized protein n=1 Tax=Collybiopsis luxurians FD-317 M1 TaxID=944289 RepID=A0A0D0BZC1_9AGAR|nr:hypothetical protein GYMLUDRAFT_248861 [Collybiopsis luxurians FD-317 M1]